MPESVTTVRAPQGLCRFGLARCDVTPPVGIYHRMWGAATHDRATGVHRPLTATALVFRPLEGGDDEQVVIAVDHVLLWAREMADLLDRVSVRGDVPRERLAVSFSHTHAGGLMGLERVELPGGDLIPRYLETLADDLAAIVRQARADARPATVTCATGRCSLAQHREFWDAASGQFVCGYNPGGPADDTVLVARVSDTAGQPLAVLVNYACHPTTLAWENTLISPDFPGALREVVEQATGVTCVFLQGASGDVGPREGFVGATAVADRNGRQLGYALLEAWESLPPPLTKFAYTGPVVSGATLGTWAHRPLSSAEREHLARWDLGRRAVELPYRTDLPTAEQTRAEMRQWREKEQAALAAGDTQTARDCHALVERAVRRLTRLEMLPADAAFVFPVTLWRGGDVFWVAVEGELYNWFQRELRQRFPDRAIFVLTLTNGSRCSYLPTAGVYGKGIYQESIAVLAPGCLERLLEEVSGTITAMQDHDRGERGSD